MGLTNAQIITELHTKSKIGSGRHLYGLLGTYTQLLKFEQVYLAQEFSNPVNLNHRLLECIGDTDLLHLTKSEANYPAAIRHRLSQELDTLLGRLLQENSFLIIKQLELVFAYELDLGVFRNRATDRNCIVLLLPGEKHGNHITIFHEANQRFQRRIPETLIAGNHLWEIIDG